MTRVALIFDFDDTLAPDSTTTLLAAKQRDLPNKFWLDWAPKLVADGYDPTHAYLTLLLDNIGKDKPLGPLNNKALREFGKTLKFFPGVELLLRDAQKIAASYKVDVECYIISGGLEEIVQAAPLVKKYFKAVYGCRLDEEAGVLRKIKRAITFTEKTRFVFEISKGITPAKVANKPLAVNEDVPLAKRPIPLDHMIYVGDGLTDIPCWSLIGKNGGLPFGVVNPKGKGPRQQFLEMIMTKRAISWNSPHYGPKGTLGYLLRAALHAQCAKARLRSES
ncbi:MAG: haloacid dehalogenase-like hydrolase [Candidatus Eisenbacteria bacterium]|nr:haloacid dehalogenase-like hydrolase [Candidatus Eisenbacteria bacterium]